VQAWKHWKHEAGTSPFGACGDISPGAGRGRADRYRRPADGAKPCRPEPVWQNGQTSGHTSARPLGESSNQATPPPKGGTAGSRSIPLCGGKGCRYRCNGGNFRLSCIPWVMLRRRNANVRGRLSVRLCRWTDGRQPLSTQGDSNFGPRQRPSQNNPAAWLLGAGAGQPWSGPRLRQAKPFLAQSGTVGRTRKD